MRSLPSSPGCYLFKDSKGKIIYVGKAKNLKKRVNSYFQKKDHDPKTEILVSLIEDVDYIVTDTEVEALILENNLIKKYQPKFNINLKDSKRYAYIEITAEKFPRAVLVRTRKGIGSFFGPFVSAEVRDLILDIVRKKFQLRTCRRFPKKECLRYHIDLCKAPCTKRINESEYNEIIKQVKNVLRGNISKTIDDLRPKMDSFSERLDFENAMVIREQINALSYLEERQKMEKVRKHDEDVINYVVKDNVVYLLLFNVKKGILHEKHEYVFDNSENFLEKFIVQYYSEYPIPNKIILPTKINNLIKILLEKTRKTNVNIVIPKIGEKKKLLTLVKKNIEATFFADLSKLEDLQKELRLNDIPRVIECFDISHISGSSTTGSMVQFRNAKPDKSNYRRFKIQSVDGVDDFKGIAEVVRRRYFRLKKENKSMPDLIIIDGGKGQLSAALHELKILELKIPIISIAKKHEEVFFPGLSIPLRLNQKSKALQFIREIRDEAHRFAIKYNKLLRSKSSFN